MKDKGMILQMVEDTFNHCPEEHEKEDFNYSDNKISKLPVVSTYEVVLSFDPIKEAFSFEVDGHEFEVPRNWSCFSAISQLKSSESIEMNDKDDLIGLVSGIIQSNVKELTLKHGDSSVKLTANQGQMAA